MELLVSLLDLVFASIPGAPLTTNVVFRQRLAIMW